MLSFKQWQLLRESTGTFNLGVSSKQNLGLTSNIPLQGNEEEAIEEGSPDMGMGMGGMGMGHPGFHKKKPMRPAPEDMDMGDEDGDEDMDMDDMDGDEDDMGDEHDHDEDDDMDLDGDHDEDDMNGDDMDGEMPPPRRKKPMMGGNPMSRPHDSGAFMNKFMSKECSCEDGEEGEGDDKDMLIKKKGGDEEGEEGGKPAFLSKKSKKSKKMKKEAASYEEYKRPQGVDTSDEAFFKSLQSHMGNTNEKFWDGLSEEVLLPPNEPLPGEAGYAPQTRIGATPEAPPQANIEESLQNLLDRFAKLEKKLKNDK